MSSVSGMSFLRNMPAIAFRSGVTDLVEQRIDDAYVTAVDDLREHLGSLSQEILSDSLMIALLTAAGVYEYPLRGPVVRYAVQKAHQFIPVADENEKVEYWCTHFLPERIECHCENEMDGVPYGLSEYVMKHPMQFMQLFDDDLTAMITTVIASGALEEIERRDREAQAQQQFQDQSKRFEEVCIARVCELHQSYPGVLNVELVEDHADQIFDDVTREFPSIPVEKESFKRTMLESLHYHSKEMVNCEELTRAISGLDTDVGVHYGKCVKLCLLYDENGEQLQPLKVNRLMTADAAHNAYQWNSQAKLWVNVSTILLIHTYDRAYVRSVEKLKDEAERLMNASNDPEERKKHEIKMRSYDSLSKKMRTGRFTRSVLQVLLPLLHDSQFLSGLDPITPYLPTADGMLVNVFTGQSRKRTINDLYTKCLNVSYGVPVSDTDMATAENFFMKLCSEIPDHYRLFLQILAVYISGYMADKSVFIGWGKHGNNGKSTLVALLGHLLGDYFSKIPKTVFIEGSGRADSNAHTAHLNPVKGRRLCACSEIQSKDVLNMGQLRELAGMERVTIRGLGKEVEVIDMTAHLMLFTNQIGKMSEVDRPSLARLMIFPMDAVFDPKYSGNDKPGLYGVNHTMEAIIKQDGFLTAVLHLLVLGGKDYHKDGQLPGGVFGSFDIPADILELKEEFSVVRCPYSEFIEECFDVAESDLPIKDRASRSSVYTAYASWCNRNGVKAYKGQQGFNVDLAAKYDCKKSNGVFAYTRLKAKPTPVPESTRIGLTLAAKFGAEAVQPVVSTPVAVVPQQGLPTPPLRLQATGFPTMVRSTGHIRTVRLNLPVVAPRT